jgi:FkbM family methyltransferase
LGVSVDDEVLDWLWEVFPAFPPGYLVDVGAGNGVNGSLSRQLLKGREWKGVLIDPLPKHAKSLSTLYQGNGRVRVVECAVMPESGEGLLYPFREVSTTRKDWAEACEAWWGHVHYSPPLTVAYRTLDSVLEEVGAPQIINLLKIDTEGADLDILKSINWNSRVIQTVVVEVLNMLLPAGQGKWRPSNEMVGLMEVNGYTLKLLSKAGNAVFRRVV